MPRELSELTLEELWQLFPVVLVDHRDSWAAWYEEEERRLFALLSQNPPARISHIGSTAIDGIRAKPIIDILVEMPPENSLSEAQRLLEADGYLCMSESPERVSLNKGYTPHGFAERVFHLHLVPHGDHDELYFRDYLNEHPQTVRAYEQLKDALQKKFRHNRDAYTEAKGSFVREQNAKAKAAFPGRYL